MGEWLSFISISGVFLAGLAFLYNKGYKHANLFLAYFLFLGFLFAFIQYATGYSGSLELSALMMTGFPSLFYLVGPCCFFYVRSILRDEVRLSRSDFLHFVPFLIVAIGTIPHLFTPWEYKLSLAQRFYSNHVNWMDVRFNLWMPDPVNQLLRPTHSLSYFIYILLLLARYFKDPDAQGRTTDQLKLMRRWFFSLVGVAILLNVSYLFTQIQLIYEPDHQAYLKSRPLSISVCVFMGLAVEGVVLLFPQILYGLPMARHPLGQSGSKMSDRFILTGDSSTIKPPVAGQHTSIDDTEDDKPHTSTGKWTPSQVLTKEYIEDIRQRIHAYVSTGVLSNPGQTIRDLAVQTDIPPHHLHYYFNHVLGTRYSDWKNRHRIDEVLEQLRADPDTPFTLDSIARNAGFEHRSTFVAAFRKVTGMLPREYMKQLK